MAAALAQSGHRIVGADLIIGGDVPLGAGLSSSAALEVAVAFALLAVSEIRLDPAEIALICQRAENEFVGAKVGIMDQFASCCSRAGFATLLDCRSLACRYVSVPEHLTIVVCDTMVHHGLAASEYNTRRAQCEAGVAALRQFLPEIQSLRDVTPTVLQRFGNSLDPLIYRRCRHVVNENTRVLLAASALERDDPAEFGELMRASHRSLRDDYEVSCEELDRMVALGDQLGHEIRGVYGGRMTGGGFGGCTVHLVEREQGNTFRDRISREWMALTGKVCPAYQCSPGAGASEVWI